MRCESSPMDPAPFETPMHTAETIYRDLGRQYLILDFHHPFSGNTLYEELLLFIPEDRKAVAVQVAEECRQFGITVDPDASFSRYSGGERAVMALVTLANILACRRCTQKKILLLNVLESLDPMNRDQVSTYFGGKTADLQGELYSLSAGAPLRII